MASEYHANLDVFTNAFILMLSGAADWHNDSEIKYKIDNEDITIEFINNSPRKTIVRKYYPNGIMAWEDHYVNGVQHGKELGWHSDGRLFWNCDYYDGDMIKENKPRNR